MTVIRSRSLEAAKIAARAYPQVRGTLPQPVARDGSTPHLWQLCTAYVVADDPALTVDDQDVVTAINKAPQKVRPADTTKAQIIARLPDEYAAAKTEREAEPVPLGAGQEPLTRG